MVDISKLNSIDTSNALSYSNFQSVPRIEDTDVSIFAGNNSVSDENVDALYTQLSEVEDKQGIFSNAWNDIKEATNIGTSVEKCDEAIQKYQKGEITFEEASAIIDEFAAKQDSSLNLFSNIATGVAAIAVATASAAAIVASGGTATPLVLAGIGAATGAATKAGFKFTDRATNEVDGDAADAKQIVKDGLSGAVTGGIAAATMGTGSAAESLGSSVAKSAARSMKTGAITGSISGASNYMIDTTFDDDKDFKFTELLGATASNAAAGTVVGGIMGSANGAMKYTGVLKNGGMVKDAGNGVLTHTSTRDIVANSACSAEYKVVNDRIRSIAA